MFVQESKKFHIVISFDKNGLTLNYRFPSILSKVKHLGSSRPNLEGNGQSMDFKGIYKC